MPAPDRRDFLRAAPLALAAAARAAAVPPPPKAPAKAKGDGGLKVITADEVAPLPAGATGRLGSPRMRLTGHMNALQFSPRGTTLVGATSGEIRAWDPGTGKVRFRLGYPDESWVEAGRLTDRDSFALLVRPNAGGHLDLRRYAFGTGKLLSQGPPLNLGQVHHTAFAADGSLVAIAHKDVLAVHDVATGAEKWHADLPAESAGGVLVFPDKATVAIALKGTVRLYAVATGKVTATLTVDGGKKRDVVERLAVSADGKWLAAAVGEDGDTVCCWDVKAGKVRHTFKPAARPVAFTPDGSELATYKDGVVTFWALATGAAARTIEVPNDDDVYLAPDGKTLGCATEDAAVLIDAATGKPLAHSADPPGLPDALWFAGPGRLVGRLTLWGGWVEWDVRAGTPRLVRPAGVGGLSPVALGPDGKTALYRRKGEYTLRDLATGKVLATAARPEEMKDGMETADLAAGGTALASPSDNGITLRGADGPRSITRSGGGSPGLARVVQASPDGSLVAVGYERGEDGGGVEVYDLAAGRLARWLPADGPVSRLRFDRDGTRLAVASDVGNRRGGGQGSVAVFDLETGKVLMRVGPDQHRGQHLTLSPDGRVLARLETYVKPGQKEAENAVALREVLTGGVRHSLKAGADDVEALAFSPDGRTVAASVHGGPVFLWDLYAGAAKSPAPTPHELDRAWEAMAAEDAAAGFGAIRLLAAHPGHSAGYLREKLVPVTAPDEGRVRQLIADLDHREYRRREAAMRELAGLGDRAVGPLRAALVPEVAPELRERVEKLLAAEGKPTAEVRRVVRAVEAMEAAGTPEAAKVLAHWAGGAAGARLTREAQAASKRMAVR